MNILQMIETAEVEWKLLGEICEVLRGKRLTKKELVENGNYPVFHGGLIPLGYYDKFNREANQTMVINTGSVGEVVWSGVDFWSSDGTFVIKTNNQICDKFLYYFLKTKENDFKNQKREGGVPTIERGVIERLPIPVPPLSLQKEIVKILDKMTELEATLEAELALRAKQYRYYRDLLLDCENPQNPFSGSLKVEWKTLGEVGEVRMCKRILKNQTTSIGDVPFYKIGTFGKKADAYISKELFDKYKSKYHYPRKGSILISASGTIGRTVIFDGEQAYFQDSNIVWLENDESKVINKFLFYYYQIVNWNIAEGGTIQRLYNDNFKKIKIPVPPLEIQAKIVEILDKFYTLTHSITEGLPREIALRRKQYEYYRAQLLNFRSA